MTYNNSTKQATITYLKAHQHEMKIRYKKDYYEEYILPAIKRSGVPVATFIKQAVAEKIDRDGLNEK